MAQADHYFWDTEHVQLGDYGGECTLAFQLKCDRCSKERLGSTVLVIETYLNPTVVEQLAAMIKHEQEKHGGGWD